MKSILSIEYKIENPKIYIYAENMLVGTYTNNISYTPIYSLYTFIYIKYVHSWHEGY